MATHSSILAWRIPWTEEPGGHSPRGCKQSDTTEMTECVLTVARQAPLWDFPGRNNRVDYHFLVQGIFLAQGSNPGFPHCRQILCLLNHREAGTSTQPYKLLSEVAISVPRKDEYHSLFKTFCLSVTSKSMQIP